MVQTSGELLTKDEWVGTRGKIGAFLTFRCRVVQSEIHCYGNF